MPKAKQSSKVEATVRRLPIASPTLPDLEAMLPRLRAIWASGELTNGKTVAELEAAVATMMPDAISWRSTAAPPA